MTANIPRTATPGVLAFGPVRTPGEHGSLYEGVRAGALASACGAPSQPRQTDFPVSRRNTLRGIRSGAVPPGQAEYATCVHGAIRDMVVDLRLGSPTFGVDRVTSLDADPGRSAHVPPGVGHGFPSSADDSCVCCVLSTARVQGTQIDINPLGPEPALPRGFTERPLMSEKDAQAGGGADAASAGSLAGWEDTR